MKIEILIAKMKIIKVVAAIICDDMKEKNLEKNAEKRRSADSCFVIYLIKKTEHT